MEGRSAGSLLAVALLVVGLIYVNMKKGDESIDMHDEILAQFEHLPDYPTHGSLYNGWLDQHHEAAFDANYTIERHGGRRGRTVTSFNDVGYLDDLFSAMATSAVQAGYKEQAEHLKHLREELTITEE